MLRCSGFCLTPQGYAKLFTHQVPLAAGSGGIDAVMIGTYPRLIAVARDAAGKPLQPGVKAAQIAQIVAALRFPSLGKCLRQFITAPGQLNLAGEVKFGGGGTLQCFDPRDVTNSLQPLQP